MFHFLAYKDENEETKNNVQESLCELSFPSKDNNIFLSENLRDNRMSDSCTNFRSSKESPKKKVSRLVRISRKSGQENPRKEPQGSNA